MTRRHGGGWSKLMEGKCVKKFSKGVFGFISVPEPRQGRQHLPKIMSSKCHQDMYKFASIVPLFCLCYQGTGTRHFVRVRVSCRSDQPGG
jgi:hypothetical protein